MRLIHKQKNKRDKLPRLNLKLNNPYGTSGYGASPFFDFSQLLFFDQRQDTVDDQDGSDNDKEPIEEGPFADDEQDTGDDGQTGDEDGEDGRLTFCLQQQDQVFCTVDDQKNAEYDQCYR